jgi:hypothetical protein
MELQSEKYPAIKHPDSNDIINSIDLLNMEDNTFLILSSSKMDYLQLAKSDSSWIAEYQIESVHNHYVCKNELLKKEDIINILNSYNSKTNDWLTKYNWEKLEISKPSDWITIVSKYSLIISSVMLLVFIWKTRDKGTYKIFGIDFIYWGTFTFIIMAVGCMKDFINWEEIDLRSKMTAVSVVIVALLMIIFSLKTLIY